MKKVWALAMVWQGPMLSYIHDNKNDMEVTNMEIVIHLDVIESWVAEGKRKCRRFARFLNLCGRYVLALLIILLGAVSLLAFLREIMVWLMVA